MIKGFYEEPKNSLDVIFLGDSSVYKGVSPMKIWKEYGITGYDFASPTQKVWDSYYCIKEVLKYQKPKVIVLDVNQFFANKPSKKSYQRHLYDNMKFGFPKIQGITDSIQQNSIKAQLSYVFPITRFHSRWSELNDEDFNLYQNQYPSVFKGYYAVNKITSYVNNNQSKKQSNQITENVLIYLDKIIQELQENQVNFVLIGIPNPKTWNEERKIEVEKWAQQHEILFLNMNSDKIVNIDWNTDTEDGGGHLNWRGAHKVSDYLGEYLVQNFDLEDYREDKNYEQWNIQLDEYENCIQF